MCVTAIYICLRFFCPTTMDFVVGSSILYRRPGGDFAPGTIISTNEGSTYRVEDTADGTWRYNPEAPKSAPAPGAKMSCYELIFLAFSGAQV